ncbi:hypothetical protein JVX90_00160 [Gordonia sp. PDNC005]|uniref:hypothetical protein n=1 Tax=Gordonia sp. PDNC005 TaxID=2811424 RepID=UPI00196348AF|nr:hypothetical protein [Gordonia sp. PDNC005]QRY62725.1 hypothetical protein JVX90_00160 [Gordonia sp. PDNC005]
MLTAELKLNGKVIGAIEIRRTYITGANGLPGYNAHTRVDNPRGAGILLHDHLVEDHDPDRDDAWELVRKALSWKADAERADLEHQRDELRAEVARLQREVSEVRYDLGDAITQGDQMRAAVDRVRELTADDHLVAEDDAGALWVRRRDVRCAIDGEADRG